MQRCGSLQALLNLMKQERPYVVYMCLSVVSCSIILLFGRLHRLHIMAFCVPWRAWVDINHFVHVARPLVVS